jgi:hypothetical protein
MSAETIRSHQGKFAYRDIVNKQYVYVPLIHNGTTSSSLLGDYAELTSGKYYAVPVHRTVKDRSVTFYNVQERRR